MTDDAARRQEIADLRGAVYYLVLAARDLADFTDVLGDARVQKMLAGIETVHLEIVGRIRKLETKE